jgi:hypothetical protein
MPVNKAVFVVGVIYVLRSFGTDIQSDHRTIKVRIGGKTCRTWVKITSPIFDPEVSAAPHEQQKLPRAIAREPSLFAAPDASEQLNLFYNRMFKIGLRYSAFLSISFL